MKICFTDMGLPVWLIALLAILLLCLMLRQVRHSRARLGYRLCMLVLDVLSLAVLALMLCQPMVKRSRPAQGTYRVAVLIDRSGSMAVRDAEGKSRNAKLNEALKNLGGSFRDIAGGGRTEYYAFASDKVYAGNSAESAANTDVLPGITPIGDILEETLLEAENTAPLAAVFLFSDGRSNGGKSPTEIAKLYGRHGIPINCVGICSNGREQDIRVECGGKVLKGVRDGKLRFSAKVHSSFASDREVELTLAMNGIVQERRKVLVPGGGCAEPEFELTPRVEGFCAYAVSVGHLEGDARLDNDSDYQAVEVSAPPVFKVLFLSGGLDWEQPFLNAMIQGDEQFELSSVIELASGKFLHQGFSEEQTKACPGFPERTSDLEAFSAVVLDGRAKLPQTTVDALLAFVENKGGGLLVRGPVDKLPEALKAILPVASSKIGMSIRGGQVHCSQEFIFTEDAAGLLGDGAGLPLAVGSTFSELRGVKRAARIAMCVSGDVDLPLLAGVAYGAGRTACLGLEESWRWRLAQEGKAVYGPFWRQLLQWLAETGKPRIRALGGITAAVGENHTLELLVAGSDFLPAPNASVSGEITMPDGGKVTLPLEPQWEEEGRYSGTFVPPMPGKYSIAYYIRLPEETLEYASSFVARQVGPEAENVSCNEELLRDLSRISNGVFAGQDEVARADFAVSQNLPMVQTTEPWASSWSLFALLLFSAAGSWWLRRKIGLK